MGDKSKIQWTDATWNPWHGCHKISPGCKLCYMFREKRQYGQDPNVVVRSKTTFNAPLRWKEPQLVFTCSWSDWLIEEADPWREEAYDIIRRTPHLTYQILTKRIDRAVGRVPDPPLPNVWLGVSVEDQERADERIPLLLQTPAAVRFISAEPLLGPVDLDSEKVDGLHALGCGDSACHTRDILPGCHGLDWVIVGGESGPDARPCNVDWVRSTVEQCEAAGVPCFVKQLGAHVIQGGERRKKKDPKGGDMDEWPHEIRVRQMPETR